MSDHSLSALSLVWNEEGAWDTTLRQLRYWRLEKKEFTRTPSVVNTLTGLPALLNYYGYALFFYHTLTAWTGQVASLPERSLRFTPHFSAFNASGHAFLPIVFGGALGTLQLTPTLATLTMAFLGGPIASPLSFLSLAICQHSFSGTEATPFLLQVGTPLSLVLPAPCDTASPENVSQLVTQQFCALGSPVVSASAEWSQEPLPPAVAGIVSLEACQTFSLQHYYCGYQWDGTSCVPIPGAACYMTMQANTTLILETKELDLPNRTLGHVFCNYSAVYTPPQKVNTSITTRYPGLEFGAGFSPIGSAVYTFVMEDQDSCSSQGAIMQACGWLWINTWSGGILGSCNTGNGCCMLNPYRGCTPGGPLNPVWGSNATLGIFGALSV